MGKIESVQTLPLTLKIKFWFKAKNWKLFVFSKKCLLNSSTQENLSLCLKLFHRFSCWKRREEKINFLSKRKLFLHIFAIFKSVESDKERRRKNYWAITMQLIIVKWLMKEEKILRWKKAKFFHSITWSSGLVS